MTVARPDHAQQHTAECHHWPVPDSIYADDTDRSTGKSLFVGICRSCDQYIRTRRYVDDPEGDHVDWVRPGAW